MLPIDVLEPAMLQAASICQTWGLPTVAAKVQPWCNLFKETESGAIVEGLVSRSQLAPQLVRERILQIRNTQQ
jgi:hypothetical protein